jgi:hypothetical protein
MSKFVKAVAILAVAAVSFAAGHATMSGANGSASARAAAQTIDPMELMRAAGPLPQTEVASYF